jgi:CRP-like cAMP-binding protein
MSTIPPGSTLLPMLRKLRLWHTLDEADGEAVLALPYVTRAIKAGQVLVWEGDRPQNCCVMLDGFTFRHKMSGKGMRQILSVHMRGDMVDLHNSMLRVADHNIQMLTDGEVAMIPMEAILAVAVARPNVGAALWYETLVDGSIFREWIVNVGRRDARTRIAHLLCELALRQEQAGLGDRLAYQMPMTQEQLADATGLTAVHVNRMLMTLREDGLISRTNRHVAIADWAALADAGDFSAQYLHVNGHAAAQG